MIHKAWCSIEEVPYYFSRSHIKFQGHTGWKIDELDQIWARLLGRSQLSNPSDLPCFFSCDQAAIWLVQSVCLSVRPSLTPFHHVPIIVSSWNFQELLPWTKVKSMQKVKVKGQGHRGQHPTWPFPDSNSSLNSHMAMKSCTQLEAA